MALDKQGGERMWQSRWEAWKAACALRHGNAYTYPSSERVEGKVRVVCKVHGEFLQRPAGHKAGKGCAVCGGSRVLDPMTTLKNTFPNLDFSASDYQGSKVKMEILCPTHGVFYRHYNSLMGTAGGAGCPKCAADAGGKVRRKEPSAWLSGLKEALPDYEFDMATLSTAYHKMRVVCREHGEFWSKPQDLVNGHGCPDCGAATRSASVRSALAVEYREFVRRAVQVHGAKYIYHTSTYGLQADRMKITCPKHGSFWQIVRNHTSLAAGCPACANAESQGEREVTDFIKGLGMRVESRTRAQLCKQEVDIYLPERRIGVEYCGLYWHSEKHRTPRYHLAKLEDAEAAGIRLIQIFEDEWLFRREATEARLRNILGVTGRSVGARELKLRKATWPEAKVFLEMWHLQGAGKPSAEQWVLCDESGILACATFGKARFGAEGGSELLRFAATCSVPGGFSRLLKAYLRGHPEVRSITSYADRRWSDGGVYQANGFTFEGNSRQGYWWCKASQRYNRHMFQKHKLSKMLKTYDPEKSEVENCQDNGYFRLFDCGISRWRLET